MGKVVNINKIRERKEKEDNSFEDVSYYFNLGWVRVNFGGAFVRDIVKNIRLKRDDIIKTIEKSNKDGIKSIEDMVEVEVYGEIVKAIKRGEEGVVKLIKGLDTPNDIDEAFQEESGYLDIIGDVLMVAMVHSYTEFNYYKMLRDNWLMLSLPVEDFMNTKEYQYIKGLAD